MKPHESPETRAALAAPVPTEPARDPLVTPATPDDAPEAAPLLLRCGLCGSRHVLIVGLAWNMAHQTGDAHYGYEVLCEECHKFSAFAHAESATECARLWALARATQAQRRAAIKQTLLTRITAHLPILRDVH